MITDNRVIKIVVLGTENKDQDELYYTNKMQKEITTKLHHKLIKDKMKVNYNWKVVCNEFNRLQLAYDKLVEENKRLNQIRNSLISVQELCETELYILDLQRKNDEMAIEMQELLEINDIFQKRVKILQENLRKLNAMKE